LKGLKTVMPQDEENEAGAIAPWEAAEQAIGWRRT